MTEEHAAGMFLTFLGAARTVTGSKTLVESDGARVLVDCGLFQGPREVRRRNWEPLPLDPSTVQAVLLTHAHLDHCGYLPLLVHDGFTGPVLCTPRTAELAAIVLRDSARLQEEDTAYARKKGYSRHAQPRPLYDSADAEAAIALLQPVPFGEEFSVSRALQASFAPAGHILGAATLRLTTGRAAALFSGDLGRTTHPLLHAPAAPSAARTIVIESTYGDRAHEDLQAGLQRMAEIIACTIDRGGTVLIPAFAVDRTEVLLHALGELQSAGRIPTVPIHVDSPMALAAMRCYLAAIRDRDPEIRDSAAAAIDLPNLQEALTPQDSMALDHGGGRIVISASGMGAGGRVVHHLKALLPDPANTVLLAGFQSPGTPGRALVDGAHELKIHGRYVKVRAEIASIGAFSVHADAHDLIAWLRSAPTPPQQVLVVHGEPDASRILADRIESELDIAAAVPEPGERIRV